LYNLYGSTEVAYATLATPADLRAAPGTVGKPMRNAIVMLLDDKGQRVAGGEVGRIFVGNPMSFEGYTSGGDKERYDGLVATGDVGRFDADGRLFVEGRDDDMIVSGGENVFPGQVEELLLARPEVADVAVVGVPDEEFGARLVAHVVAADAGSIDTDALRSHVKQSLGRIYVPREVVVHDELPRNATGKVLKRELRENAAD
jgi:fatty-acyl-CoA synthase